MRYLICLSAITMLVLFCCSGDDPILAPKDDGIITIGVYVGDGALQDSFTAAQKMFQWIGYTVKFIDATIINLGKINMIDVFYFPAGIEDKYRNDISPEGRSNIKTMIYSGSNYIGSGAGAIYAGTRFIQAGAVYETNMLSLFSGDIIDKSLLDVTATEQFMCQINYVKSHPITEFSKTGDWMLYDNSPHFEPYDNMEYDVIGRYHLNGEIALLAFDYGKGRVFLTGTHPEYEEDSERDGVSYFDHFDDLGSEWDMMKLAVEWCIQ
ncbi:hypothetical protein JXB12_01285 [candidate division KSB1 bacterium]|nr:hypothetical protein [candidate division KSB1 bacterium]